MNSLEKQFTCTFQKESKSYLIQLKVEGATTDLNNLPVIKTIVKETIGKDSYLQQANKNIRLKIEPTRIRVYNGLAIDPTDYDREALPAPAVIPTLRIIDVANRTLPLRTLTFSENYNSLWLSWPIWIPVVNFAWWLVICPLICLARCYYPKKVLDTSTLQFKSDPHHRLALEDALQEAVDIMEPYQQEASKGIVTSFREAVNRAKAWRENPATRAEQTDNLFARLEENLTNNKPMVIAGGYWKDRKIFEPILWSFTLGPGHVVLSEMAYGKEGLTPRLYTFEKLEKDKCKQLLYNLMALTEKESDIRQWKAHDFYALAYVGAIIAMSEHHDHDSDHLPEELAFLPSSIHQFKEALIVEAGGKPLPVHEHTSATRCKLSNDPMKLIHEILHNQFPEAPFENKALFSLHVLHHRLNIVLQALPTLSKEEKEYWISHLQKKYTSLQRQLGKANYGNSKEAMAVFGNALQKLKLELDKQHSQSKEGQENRIQQLNQVKSHSYQVKLDTSHLTFVEERQATTLEKVIPADVKDIELLSQAFEQVPAKNPHALPLIEVQLKKLVFRINALIVAKQYEAAKEICRLILPLIPEPSDAKAVDSILKIVETGFWKALLDVSEDVAAQKARASQIKSISDEWGKLTHYFWECKVRTDTLLLQADEWVYMLNMEAALWQCMQIRMKLLDKVPADQRSTEERNFMAIAPEYKNNSQYGNEPDSYHSISTFCGFYNIEREMYLRPEEHPLLAKKYLTVQEYLKKIPKEGWFDAPAKEGWGAAESRSYHEQCHCKKALEAAGKPSDEKAVTELFQHYYDRNFHDETAIPSQFSDIGRHQLFFASMLKPLTAIGHSKNTYKSTTKKLQYGLKGIVGNIKDRQEEAKQRYLAAKEVLDGYDRLQIASRVYKKENTVAVSIRGKYIKKIDYGIVPTNYQFGTVPDICLDPEGLASIHRIGVKLSFSEHLGYRHQLRRDYKKHLGKPSNVFNSVYADGWGCEATQLSKILASENPHFLDRFHLEIKGHGERDSHIMTGDLESPNSEDWYGFYWHWEENTNIKSFGHTKFIPYQNFHNAFDRMLQSPALIEYREKNAEGHLAYDGQRRFYEVLFCSRIVPAAIKQTPEYFLSHAEPIKKLLDISFTDKNWHRFYFLLYLVNTIQQHIVVQLEQLPPAEAELRKNVANILLVWPHMETICDAFSKESYLTKAFLSWEGIEDTQVKIDAAAYLIALFSNNVHCLTPNDELIPALGKTVHLAKLLQIGNYLHATQGLATLPIVAEQGIQWMKEYLIPFIYSSVTRRDAVLNAWTEENPANPWQEVPGRPYTFTKDKKDKATCVDLKNIQILSLKGKSVKGIANPLPSEVLIHFDYQRYFGTKNFSARMQPGKTLDQYIYTFKDDHKIRYRILFDVAFNTLSIERREKPTDPWLKVYWPMSTAKDEFVSATWIDYIIAQFSRRKYLNSLSLYERNKMDIEKAVGMEKHLLQSGIWVHPKKPYKGMVYLQEKVWKENQEVHQETALKVRLNSSGQVQSLHTIDGLEVVHADQNTVGQAICCFPKEQILFLKKPKNQAVTEIRFLHQKICLKRASENNPWILHGDDSLEGAEWVVGEKRGLHANKLWQTLGEHADKIGFTVRKGDRVTFIHWPHQTNDRQAKVNQTLQYSPPLQMTITEGNEIVLSAASGLYLAYQFSLKQDYVRAMHYVQRARVKKVDSISERMHFPFIEKCLIELPTDSLRAAAFKLKALLALRKINREQNPEPSDLNIKEAFSSDQLIKEAHSAYCKQMYRGPFAGAKEAFLLKEESYLSLTGEESDELRFILDRSFAWHIKQLDRSDLLSSNKMHLQIIMPSLKEIQLSLPLLVKRMSKKQVDPDELLKNLRVSEESVLEHFFPLYNIIQERGITPDKLKMLFYPNTQILETGDKETLKRKQKAVEIGQENATALIGNPHLAALDLARKLLLVAACENLPGAPAIPPERRLDLGIIKELQASLPNWFLTNKHAIASSWFARRNMHARERNAAFIQKQEEWQKLAQKLHRPVGDQVFITMEGLKDASVASDENKIQAILGKKLANLKGIANAVGQDQNLFGSMIHAHLRAFLQTLDTDADMLALQKAPGLLLVDDLIQAIDQRHGIDIAEAMREEQGKKRIAQLEKEVLEAKRQCAEQKKRGEGLPEVKADLLDPLVQFAGQPIENRLGTEFAELWSQEIAASSVATQKANLKIVSEQLIAALAEESDDPMEKTANRRLAKGVKEAAEFLHAKIEKKTSISKENIGKLRTEIEGQKAICQKKMCWERGDILVLVKKPEVFKDLSPKIQHAIRNPDTFHEDELLYLLENAYQSLELKDARLCLSITRYLMEKVALKVLSDEIENQMKFLEKALEQGASPTANDWIQAATLIHNLMERALNFERYMDPTSKQLTNPRLNRKVLVLESRQAIIATKEQLDMTVDMYRKPTDWYELKVGLGKTSVVFKLLFLLLIEEGERPTAVGREELLKQLEDSLDRGTRESSEYAGVDFTFGFNDPISPLILQEKYIRLLEVRAQKGYPITSASSIQAIDQKLQTLHGDLEKAIDAIHKDADAILQLLAFPAAAQALDVDGMRKNQESLRQFSQIDTIQRNIYYLNKIKEDLNFLIIDEADDVLGVTKENNVGLGEATILDQTIQRTMEHMMRIVLDPDIKETASLREALISQRQAALDKEMPNLMMQLAVSMLQDEQYFVNYVGIQKLQDEPKSFLLGHLITVFKKGEAAPPLPDLSEDAIMKLGALKYTLQVVFPRALRQQPNIDSGVKESDEFQIGPKACGRELWGTIFGEQSDTIINHYLYYSLSLPASDTFVKMGLKRIQERHFDNYYSNWKKEAGEKDLITFLNEPGNYMKRMDFLRLVILDEKMIRHFNKQIVFNVQDLCRDRRVGGMTGTRNRDCLPFTGEEHPPESKKIIAQVLLEAAILALPQVTTVAEEKILEKMQECAKNYEYKAIMNQGYFLEKGDTKQWIAKLREAAPDRIYVFVDSLTRKFVIWRPKEEPKEISPNQLAALRFTKEFKEKGLAGYGTGDNRGVHIDIPTGKEAAFIYPNGSLDDFVQLLGRARGAGDIHSMDFFISNGIKKRMRAPKNQEELLYILLILDVCQKDLFQQTGRILKSAEQNLKTIVKMGTHQLIFGNKKERDNPTYWNVKGAEQRLLDLMQIRALMKVAGDPVKGWLEETRKLNLKRDFVISRHEDTKDMVKKVYLSEKRKIDRLAQFMQADTAFQLGCDDYLDKLEKMLKELELAYDRFLKKANDLDEVIFPATVPTNGGGLPTMQAQMQQVEQQQVQQKQQQVQGASGNKKGERFKYKEYDPQQIVNAIFSLALPKAVRGPMEFLWLNTHIQVTSSFIYLFQLMNGQIKGDLSFCRLLVKGNNLCLITANDYSHGIGYHDYDAIYSFMDPRKHNEGLLLNKLGNLQQWDPLMDPQVRNVILPQIVQAKWFLGFSEYTKEEEKILQAWLISMKKEPLPLFKLHVQQLGTHEQEKKMHSLINV